MINTDTISSKRSIWLKCKPFAAFLFWVITILYFAFFSLCAATRWFILPHIGEYKTEIAAVISKATGAEVTIGEIRPEWTLFRPQVTLRDLRLSSPSEREGERDSLVLKRVSAIFHWRTLLGKLSFRKLEIGDSHLTVRKLPDGSFEVGGIRFSSSGGNSSETDDMVIGWLVDQRELSITNSSIDLADLSHARPRKLSLSSLNMLFKKSLGRWSFGLQAVQHAPGAPKIDIRANFSPALFSLSTDWTGWKGEFYALLEDINAADIVSDTPLEKYIRAAYGSIEVSGKFHKGTLRAIDAKTCLTDLDLKLADDLPNLNLTELSVNAKGEYDGKDARLSVRDLVFQPQGGPLAGPTQLDAHARLKPDTFKPMESSLSVRHIDLALLSDLIETLPVSESVLGALSRHDPRGVIESADITWSGDIESPRSWAVTTSFKDLGVNSVPSGTTTDGIEDPGIPGFTGISGKASVSSTSGHVEILSTAPSLSFPGVFENPTFKLNALSGTVRWKNEEKAPLKVTFDNVTVDSPSAHLVTSGSWTDTGGAGTVDITGKAGRGRAQDVWLFMPLVIPKDVRDWLQAGLVRGRGDNCDVILKGDLNDFPWESPDTKGKGRFYIKTDVSGVALDYVPNYKRDMSGQFERGSSWPLLTDIAGTLTFNGMEMTVDATSADTLGAHVTKAWAQIPSLIDSDAKLLVDGTVENTPLANGISYLAESPVGAILGNAFAKTKVSGDIGLQLKLDIPLLHAEDTKVNGLIRFRGNSVDMGWPVPPVTELTGPLTFTHQGAISERLTAKAFSHPVSATVATVSPGLVRARLDGQTDIRNVTFFENSPITRTALKPLSGKTAFEAELLIGKDISVRVNTNLAGIASSYPEPLAKLPETAWPTQFLFATQGRSSRIELRAASKLQLLLDMPGGTAQPVTGTVAIGKEARLPQRGISVEVNSDRVVADEWDAPVKSLIDAIQSQMSANRSAASQFALSRINVDVNHLMADDLDISDLRASASQNDQSKWHIVVNSNQIEGSANWSFSGGGMGSVSARFDKLHVPGKSSDRIKDILGRSAEASLPSISAKVAKFQYGDFPLGSVTLEARNARDEQGPVWLINSLSVANSGGTLNATGNWRSAAGGNVTTIHAKADIKDSGNVLSIFGIKDAISGAAGTGSVNVSWKGLPWQPALETFDGDGELHLAKGNLRQVSTGAGGALLSLVSMQSLMKRLTLDFSDLSSGLAFDTFGGSFDIEAGKLRTDDFRIASSKAAILISGDAALPAETLDFSVLVLPDVNALGASLALTAVNPVVGIGSFLAQLVLRNPLSNMFSTQYSVKGTFSDPIITKVQSTSRKPSLIKAFTP
jgi:uncharacterized protein (TIGR02099 family)